MFNQVIWAQFYIMILHYISHKSFSQKFFNIVGQITVYKTKWIIIYPVL